MTIRYSLSILGLIVLNLTLPASTEAVDPAASWKRNCQRCHGAEGKADTRIGKMLKARDLTDPAVQKDLTDEAISRAILEGVQGDSGTRKMPAFADTVSPEELPALVAYVRSLKAP